MSALCPACGRLMGQHDANCPTLRKEASREIEATGSTAIPDSPCRQALEFVYGDREDDYDHPARNFSRIARLWSAYLTSKHGVLIEIEPREVGWLNILQKCSRDMHSPKPDNLTDTAGYAEAMSRAGEFPADNGTDEG